MKNTIIALITIILLAVSSVAFAETYEPPKDVWELLKPLIYVIVGMLFIFRWVRSKMKHYKNKGYKSGYAFIVAVVESIIIVFAAGGLFILIGYTFLGILH